MKKAGIVVCAILCVAIICGGFFLVKHRTNEQLNQESELTEVEKLITKNMNTSYPETPREVIKLYNRIITAYYKEDYSKEQLSQLADHVLAMFDAQLLEVNPRESYLSQIQADIDNYKKNKKWIAHSDVCDTNEVEYVKKDKEELAYVVSSYFVRQDSERTKTYQEYVLRKDEFGQWKILGFYQIKAAS